MKDKNQLINYLLLLINKKIPLQTERDIIYLILKNCCKITLQPSAAFAFCFPQSVWKLGTDLLKYSQG